MGCVPGAAPARVGSSSASWYDCGRARSQARFAGTTGTHATPCACRLLSCRNGCWLPGEECCVFCRPTQTRKLLAPQPALAEVDHQLNRKVLAVSEEAGDGMAEDHGGWLFSAAVEDDVSTVEHVSVFVNLSYAETVVRKLTPQSFSGLNCDPVI